MIGIPTGSTCALTPMLCPDKIFTGHYAASRDEPFSDHFQSTSGDSSVYAWHLPINEKFHDQIKSCSLFYKVASIDIDSIAPTGKYARLKFDSFDWDALAARPTLPDDYQSHCSVVPNSLFTFNSRLNIEAQPSLPPLPCHYIHVSRHPPSPTMRPMSLSRSTIARAASCLRPRLRPSGGMSTPLSPGTCSILMPLRAKCLSDMATMKLS